MKKRICVLSLSIALLFALLPVPEIVWAAEEKKNDIAQEETDGKEPGEDSEYKDSIEEPEEYGEGYEEDNQAWWNRTTLEKQVVAEQEGIKITAESLDYNYNGITIKFLLESSRQDNVIVTLGASSVNNIMVNTGNDTELLAGKKAYLSLSFDNTEMAVYGIEQINTIDFLFGLADMDSGEALFLSEPVEVKVKNRRSYEQRYSTIGRQVYNRGGVRVVYLGYGNAYNPYSYDSQFVFYIENYTDKWITLESVEMSVNDFMVSPYFSSYVGPGKKTYATLEWYAEEYGEGMLPVSSAEMKLVLYDAMTGAPLAKSNAIHLPIMNIITINSQTGSSGNLL